MTTSNRAGLIGKCPRSALVHFVAAGACTFLLFVSGTRALSQAKPAAGASEKPVVTATVPSIDRVYDDLKFLFDLAGDANGYKTFKDTVDVFLEGVETNKPVGVRTYVAADGLRTVASLPVKDEAAFKKFLHNVWDLDVKTAPPPQPSLLPQVPRPVQEKLKSLKLESNERMLFGLAEGFLKFESGQIHIGKSLEDVRAAQGSVPAGTAKGATLEVRIDGDAAAGDRRRAAFEKTKEDILSRHKKADNESESDFALRHGLLDLQLARMEILFAEAAHTQFEYTVSHERKRTELSAEVSGLKGTSLAAEIEHIGQSPDEFAGISKEGAVLTASINAAVNPTLGKSLKSVSGDARTAVNQKIEGDHRLDAGQKTIDSQFSNLVFDIIDDVAGMPVFNGFVRTWANTDGSLTTVGAVKVPDGGKYREAVQKFKNRERVQSSGSGDPRVEIDRVTVSTGQKDFPELFEKDGSVYLATSDQAVWYALGEKSLERLQQAIEEGGSRAAKGTTAAELHAEMLPLVAVWDKIRSRHTPRASERSRGNDKHQTAARTAAPARPKTAEKSKAADKSKPIAKSQAGAKSQSEAKPENRKEAISRAKSLFADLELRKVALDAFQGGGDTLSLSVSRKGDKAVLSAQFDEGILRFYGKALSKFTKENLEE